MTVKTKKETRREQILKAAEKVFSQKDYQNSTISDVAKETGVSDATIYEYFSSKEELLFSIPRDNIENSKEILDYHLNYIKGTTNKFRSTIYHLLKYYQDNPDFASISLMTLKTNRKFMETTTYKDLREYYNVVIKIINDGIESGEFREDTDPHLIRSVLLGSVEFIVIRWLMYGCPQDKTQPIENVDPLFDLIVGGIKKDKKLSGMNFRIKIEPEDEAEAE